MIKVSIEFTSGVTVKAVVHEANISDGALVLQLDDHGSKGKVIPFNVISCIDLEEADGTEGCYYG